MEYRYLGPTGIKVSVIGFGNWITGHNEDDEKRITDLVQKAFDLGINFFDTAENYGNGNAEICLGKALKNLNLSRDSFILSTKLFYGDMSKTTPNSHGLSRKHIWEGMQMSLKRLQVEYVDVVFAHRFDAQTPMEEVCRAFNHLIEKGLAFYWGTSEWSAAQVRYAHEICEKLNLTKPISEQPQYNMFVREKVEVEFAEIFDEKKMGCTCWSPLAGGILTGKYNDGIETGSRFSSDNPFLKNIYDRMFFNPSVYEIRREALKNLKEIAEKELNCTLGQLAMAWVISNPDISVAITGASRPQQLEETVKAVEIMKKLTPELLERIETILDTRPKQEMNWRLWKPKHFRR